MSKNIDTSVSPEKYVKPRAEYIGRLSDLQLGNPEGIPSDLAGASKETLDEVGEQLTQTLVEITDTQHYGCIDGRCVICGPGERVAIRGRQVGGTALLTEVALNSGASIVDTLKNLRLGSVISGIENHYQGIKGISSFNSSRWMWRC